MVHEGSRPKVSVLIVNRNGEQHLETCIRSILASDYDGLEVVVLDCASSDGSVALVRNLFPSCKVIEFEYDPLPDAAYIQGVLQSSGELILLLNNDTRLLCDTIGKLVKDLQEDPNSLVVPLELDWEGRFFHGSAGLAYYWITPLYALTKWLPFYRRKRAGPFMVNIACAMISRDLFLQVPPSVLIGFFEELEWCWRLLLLGFDVRVVSEARYFHKGAASVGSTRRTAMWSAKSMLAAHYVCLDRLGLLAFTPLLLCYVLLKSALYLLRLRFGGLLGLVEGIIEFMKLLDKFREQRIAVQTARRATDISVFSKMLLSCHWVYSFNLDRGRSIAGTFMDLVLAAR